MVRQNERGVHGRRHAIQSAPQAIAMRLATQPLRPSTTQLNRKRTRARRGRPSARSPAACDCTLCIPAMQGSIHPFPLTTPSNTTPPQRTSKSRSAAHVEVRKLAPTGNRRLRTYRRPVTPSLRNRRLMQEPASAVSPRPARAPVFLCRYPPYSYALLEVMSSF